MKYEYARESRVGAWTYARETLSLDVSKPPPDQPNAPTSVFVLIHGKYAWDAPSTWISIGLSKLFGRYSEGVVYLFLPL